MNDHLEAGPHHHVHGAAEYALVTEAVRATLDSGVLRGYEDFGVVIERRKDSTLFIYVIPVRPDPGVTVDA